MKMNQNNLLKASIAFCLLIICSINANAQAGVWQSRLVEVQYDPKATNKRLFASVYQIWGKEMLESGNTEYFASPKLTMIMETIKMPAKSQN